MVMRALTDKELDVVAGGSLRISHNKVQVIVQSNSAIQASSVKWSWDTSVTQNQNLQNFASQHI